MQTFLEEYGKVIVVIIAVAVLIALVVFVSNMGKTGTEKAVNKFTTEADKIVDEQLGSAETAPTNTP